ncbi:hypothetical protein, partial [Pseudomonas sp. efr-133-TYG-103a]|uniref:hypothetical protein n=1 Tax=Pseudomonas sp. efr-133-TYG-103a TaxID=3040308 RepID=UPI0025562999
VKIKFQNPICESRWGFVFAREKSAASAPYRLALQLRFTRYGLSFVGSRNSPRFADALFVPGSTR